MSVTRLVTCVCVSCVECVFSARRVRRRREREVWCACACVSWASVSVRRVGMSAFAACSLSRLLGGERDQRMERVSRGAVAEQNRECHLRERDLIHSCVKWRMQARALGT